MFKSSFFLKGSDGGDPFQSRGDEAAELVSACFPALSGYTQSRTLPEQVDPAAAVPFTGVAELWFNCESAAIAAEGEAGKLSDLLARGTSVVATASGMMRSVMRLPSFYDGGLIKGVFPFRCQDSIRFEAFQSYWWQQHGPIAARTEGAVCYTQCHPTAACYADGQPAFDGITELYWPDVAAARAAMGSRQMIEVQAADAENFAEPGSVLLFLASEEVVIPA